MNCDHRDVFLKDGLANGQSPDDVLKRSGRMASTIKTPEASEKQIETLHNAIKMSLK